MRRFIFKVHNRIHKSPPPVPILTHSNPVHASPSHFLKIAFPYSQHLRLGIPSGSFPQVLPSLNPACTSSVSYTCHMACPSLSFWLHHPKNVWWAVQITKPLIMKSSSVPRYLVPLRPRLPRHPVLENPQLTFLPHRERPSFKLL